MLTQTKISCNTNNMEDNFQNIRKIPNFLDHLHVFVLVYEEGSLSAAARKLNRAVSSVSYSLSQLEFHTGTALLTRTKTGVELTPVGEAIFAEARLLVDQSSRLSAHFLALERGEEPTLRVLVDVLIPNDVLSETLRKFGQASASVRLQIFHASLNTMWEDVRSGHYDLAIALTNQVPLDMVSERMAELDLSPYCASTHPLAQKQTPLDDKSFQPFRQIYFIADPSINVQRVGRVFSLYMWSVDDIEMLRRMVIDGLGWCFGTKYTFAEEMAAGTITRLKTNSPNLKSTRSVCAVQMNDQSLGKLGRKFVEALRESVVSDNDFKKMYRKFGRV